MAKLTRTLNFYKLREELKRRKQRAAEGYQKGARRSATQVLRRSNYYVPIDTEDLRKSGKVIESGSGLTYNVSIQYDTPYAVIVHEDMSLAHGYVYNFIYASDIAAGRTHRRRPQEQAKFLSLALQETRQYCITTIYSEVKSRQ